MKKTNVRYIPVDYEYIRGKNDECLVSLDKSETICIKPLPKLHFEVYKHGKKTSTFKLGKPVYIFKNKEECFQISNQFLIEIAETAGFVKFPTKEEKLQQFLSIKENSLIYKSLNKALIPFWLDEWGFDIFEMSNEEMDKAYEKHIESNNLLEGWLRNIYKTDIKKEKERILDKSYYLRKLMAYMWANDGISRAKADYYLRLIRLEPYVNKYRILESCLFNETDRRRYKSLYNKYNVYDYYRYMRDVPSENAPFKSTPNFTVASDGKHYIVEKELNMYSGFNGFLGIFMQCPIKESELINYCIYAEAELHTCNDKTYKLVD